MQLKRDVGLGTNTARIPAGSKLVVSTPGARPLYDTVTIMVSTDDDSTVRVYTKDQADDSTFYVGASQPSSTTCYQSGRVTVLACPDSLAVVITCQNWFFDCPVHYSVSFAMTRPVCGGGSSTPSRAACSSSDRCSGCSTCAGAQACVFSGSYCPYGSTAVGWTCNEYLLDRGLVVHDVRLQHQHEEERC